MLLKLDNVLNDAQIAEVRKILDQAKWIDGTVSGKASLKQNMQADRGTADFDSAIRIVITALMARQDFKDYAFPKQITLEFNRYDPGMFYKNHMDSALMGGVRGQVMRTDLSFTVALTDPTTYKGGEFVLQTSFGEEHIKLEPGNGIVYPSSMIHRVDPIEDGTRWAAIGWIQSLVRDDAQREILYEIQQLGSLVTKTFPDSEYQERFDHLKGNLTRLWAEA